MAEENADEDVVVEEQEEEQSAPEATPPPEPPKFPAAPKVPPIPRASSSAGAPPSAVKYQTTITQEVMPKEAGNGNGHLPEQAPSLPRPKSIEQLIDQIGEHGLDGFCVRVWTISPYAELVDERGCPSVPQGPYQDLIAHLRESYGPGTYRIRVEHNGITVAAIGTRQVTIQGQSQQPQQSPLLTPQYPGPQMGAQMHPGAQFASPYQLQRLGGNNLIDEEVKRLQTERQRVAALRELKREQAALEKESKALLDEAQGKTAEPEESAAVAELKAELAELKGKLADKPKEESLILPILLKMIEVQATKPQDTNMRDSLALIVESNRSALEAAKENAQQNREMAMMFMQQKNESGTEQFKQSMDIAHQIISLTRGDDGRLEIDPENPWPSLVAQVASRGIEALSEIFKNGAPAIQELIARRVNKPRAAVTQQDLSVLADQLKRVEPLRPPPATQAQGLSPSAPGAPAPVKEAPPELYSPPNETTNPAAPAEVVANTPVEGQAQAAPTPPAAAPSSPSTTPVAPAVSPELAEQDVREKVLICVEDYMLVDLAAERAEHDWPSYAGSKWPKEFKERYLACPGHEERIALIKGKVAPEIWAKVEALINKPNTPNLYAFQMALNAVVTEITGVVPPEPGAPTP